MVLSVFSFVIGILSLLYFIVYFLIIGVNNPFTLVWMLLGIVGIVYAFAHKWVLEKGGMKAKYIEGAFQLTVLIALLVFSYTLSLLIKDTRSAPSQNADYVIILGAHVYGERMSQNLRYRVEAAYEYLKENPDTKVVLSGGKGHGEDITEAEAMRRYLTKQGIASGRIWMDETSANTDENIRNSAKIIGDKEKSVVIVSSNFHIFRAKAIAKKQGYKNVEGIAAKTTVFTVPQNYTREVVAVLKYKLCGEI